MISTSSETVIIVIIMLVSNGADLFKVWTL